VVPRPHPDDRHRLAVDDERSREDVGATGEPVLPERVAQHRDAPVPLHPIVVRADEPSERRLDAECWEVAAGHGETVAGEGLADGRQVGAEQAVRGQARERRLPFLEVPEHRVAEYRFARARRVAGRGA
jgi:hypothetical protein